MRDATLTDAKTPQSANFIYGVRLWRSVAFIEALRLL